jgi:hypothetical protein
MSGMAGRVAAAISRMERVRREMAERRGLRQRHGAEIRASSVASLTQHAAAAQQAARDLGERARRRQAAGGWSTSSTDRDRNPTLGLGLQDNDDPPAVADQSGHRPPPVVTPPPVPVVPERTSPPAARRPTRPRRPEEDDDDFSGHSWMVNR